MNHHENPHYTQNSDNKLLNCDFLELQIKLIVSYINLEQQII